MDACIEWPKGRDPKGYGITSIGGKQLRVHRVAYEWAFGFIPDGLCVMHQCDNPPCINPGHLFVGTHQDNKADAVLKGRHAHGETGGHARLTEAQVLEIRAREASGEHTLALAKEFGVNGKSISMICNGDRWRHLPLARKRGERMTDYLKNRSKYHAK